MWEGAADVLPPASPTEESAGLTAAGQPSERGLGRPDTPRRSGPQDPAWGCVRGFRRCRPAHGVLRQVAKAVALGQGHPTSPGDWSLRPLGSQTPASVCRRRRSCLLQWASLCSRLWESECRPDAGGVGDRPRPSQRAGLQGEAGPAVEGWGWEGQARPRSWRRCRGDCPPFRRMWQVRLGSCRRRCLEASPHASLGTRLWAGYETRVEPEAGGQAGGCPGASADPGGASAC